ncbi:aromatic compound dioxygenase [Wilcoxina mikolae CBS 423.85]|nr:aromatic compound dioxygenase [Wilcoxina mikolae CBS 423.85]
MQITRILATLTLLVGAIAHPGGHDHGPEELQKQDALWQHAKRSIADCSSSLMARGARLLGDLNSRRNFVRNEDYHPTTSRRSAGVSRKMSIRRYCSLETPAPEVTQGPYYVSREKIRYDLRENQPGVDLFLDLQFIDINTCEPVPDTYVDIWHANATGVYSGVVASGNGDSTDATNLDATFLRGLWKTNDEGVVQFLTLFPGHYTGRAHHTHLIAHQGGTQNLNATYSGGKVTHIGQLFYDTSLQEAVSAIEPYASNSQDLTSNEDDMLAPSASGDDFDPFVQYVYLGDIVEDGVFGWVSIGIDTSQTYNVSSTATLTEDRGVANSDFSAGGGDGPEMNDTGRPSGSAPSGARPSLLLP